MSTSGEMGELGGSAGDGGSKGGGCEGGGGEGGGGEGGGEGGGGEGGGGDGAANMVMATVGALLESTVVPATATKVVL